VDWLVIHEFARTAEDIVWRRTKLGLRMTAQQIDDLTRYLERPETRALWAMREIAGGTGDAASVPPVQS
jgi:glycerol-3-phosphate dehydrogenase